MVSLLPSRPLNMPPFALLLAMVCATTASHASAWEPAKQDKAVTVHTRAVADSGVREFRGVTEISAPVPAILVVMSDPALCTEWVHNCAEAHIIEAVSPTERFSYQVTDMPWPTKSRDLVLHIVTTIDKDTGSTHIQMDSAPDKMEHTGHVRITRSSGHYLLEPIGDSGRTRVTWTQHTEPGGKIPKWLINSLVVDLPINSLSNLRRLAESGRFRDATLPAAAGS